MTSFYEYYFYFLNNICPPLLFIIGMIGNTIVILVFSRKAFNKYTSKNYFCALSIIDIFNSIMIIIYHPDAFQSYFICVSQLTCKLTDFSWYFLPASSSWLLVFIGIDRLVLVRYRRIKIFEQKKMQLSIICVILAWNFSVYVERLHFSSLELNNTNDSCNTNSVCDIFEEEAAYVSSWIDLVNSTITPFLIMITCSSMIIHSIFIARKKFYLNLNKSKAALSKLKKDIRFSITIVTLDMLFFICNLPICVYYFFNFENDFVFCSLDMLFYLQFITNFFIYFCLNPEFQRELFLVFCKKVVK